MTKIKFIGAYKIDLPKEEIDAIVSSSKHPAFVTKELSTLALVELEVTDVGDDFDLMYIKQPHTDCVPYYETYYDPGSLKAIVSLGPTSVPKLKHFRVAFFLHFFDPNQVLNTRWGDLSCSEISSLPPHLVNKIYVYWR